MSNPIDARILDLLKEARTQLESEREKRTGPIAIVGIGCRLPGGVFDADSYWQLLSNGVDATSDVPPERWDAEHLYDPDADAPGKSYVKRASFLDQIDRFDADFFGISPREALGMDPQQRLLLEVVWEAIEDSGIPVRSLRGSATGVWVGLCLDDYARRSITSGDTKRIDTYNTLGNIRSVAAGRVAYVLDLHGPAVQLDTACSSSLVAIHQACNSLRNGECNLAIAGGVNLLASPEMTIALCRMHALARDGRCKSFDAAADGFGRGEGCGVILLERLSDAVAAGHHIYAVVRGTATNHDGHSNGLTAPSGPAQQAVIRAALANGNIEARDVGFVETHGTGTLLGDPIEVMALQRVYGQNRSKASPLYLGAVKTNFGHLEGAAGVAGVIKVALCLSRKEIPANLHQHTPNPKIPWADLPIEVVRQRVAWTSDKGSRLAGVSSFGISGTNAHLVLEEAPRLQQSQSAAERSAELVVLSAKTPGSLRELAERLLAHVENHPEVSLGDLAYSLLSTRSPLERRLAFAVPNRDALLSALRQAGAAEPPAPAALGLPKTVFVFPGQGSQWLGMGRELLAEEPAFRAALEQVDRAIQAEVGWSVLEELQASPEQSRLNQVDVVQPVLFAFQVALAALWRAWGVEPAAVIGHSLGEVAAACVAGALSLHDAVAVICRRSKLLRRISGQGEMALVELSVEDAGRALSGYEDRLAVAVSNGPRSSVLSGDPAALSEVITQLEARSIFCRRVKVDVASHSPQVDPLLDDLVGTLAGLAPGRASVAMFSTVTGQRLAGSELDASYWAQNLRQPVRFGSTVSALLAADFTHFLEISAHPLLVSAVDQLRTEQGASGASIGSLRREQPERQTLLEALGVLHVGGQALDVARLFPHGGQRTKLPSYAWQGQRFWLEAPAGAALGAGLPTSHPLLGARVSSAGADAVYETLLSAKDPSYLADHRVNGQVLVPAAAIAELVRAAASDLAMGAPWEQTSLVLQAPLRLSESGATRIQVVLSEQGARASVYSQPARADAAAPWQLHATSELAPASAASPAPLDVRGIRRRCSEPLDVAAMYAHLCAAGLDYGPAFRGMTSLWRGDGEAFAELQLPVREGADAYGLHPVLLDAALHAVAALHRLDGGPLLPIELGHFLVHRYGADAAVAHVRTHSASDGSLEAEVTLASGDGEVIASINPLRVRQVDAKTFGHGAAAATTSAFYRLEWPEVPADAPANAKAAPAALRVLDTSAAARVLASDLRNEGLDVERVGLDAVAQLPAACRLICAFDVSGPDGAAALRAANDALGIAQVIVAMPAPPRLVWVTRGGISVLPGEDASPAAAALWGLGRTLREEQPQLAFGLVDVEPTAAVASVLARELRITDDENEVAWRGGARHAARLVRAVTRRLPDAENYQLEARHKGTLDSLTLSPCERRLPDAGEVEIEVLAAGLNFRDVVDALGLVQGGKLGRECAGVVRKVGANVQRFAVGDSVMAVTSGTFARYVCVDARLVARVPRGITIQQAATIPIVFLTAWYALHDLARLRAGERLLVHAAAGGVGMAAIQIARWIGAEVYATASRPKWDVVRSLGVAHVASSRDTSFVSAIRESTDGVDVVLDSLTGELVDAGLSLLGPGGRFIEMGKTDIRDPMQVSQRHPGVTYRAFELMDPGADHLATLFDAVVAGFEAGRLKPLPLRAYPLAAAEEAFRFMAQARHTGKLVLTAGHQAIRPDSSALITGGLGAIGAVAARVLVSHGVKHLVLTGRRGRNTPGADALIAELESMGARVVVEAIDVANAKALAEVLGSIPSQLPLRAIVHAAGVLDDGVLPEQTSERFAHVMSAKVLGAWHLHQMTAQTELDLFISCSSLAGTLGSASQSGYAAANAFLDGLASHRRAHGLPATSLAWGPWSEQGLAAHLDGLLRARLARQGVQMITPNQGRELFEEALGRFESQLVVAPLDLRTLGRTLDGTIPPLWRGLLRPAVARQHASSDGSNDLARLTPEERAQATLAVVRGEVARILSSSAGAIPVDRPLKDLGLDSLMALELRNALGRRYKLTLPATLAFDYPTPAEISRFILGLLGKNSGPERSAGPQLGSSEDPIAVVGIGVRIPGGVRTLEDFWRLLEEGRDAITLVPPSRWDNDEWYDPDPDALGKVSTCWGGFLDDIESFEPAFFGISPREAPSIDPQQRLLLETAWEALEGAGIKPESLLGSETGVYVGMSNAEYQSRLIADAKKIDAYGMLGTMHSTIAGRLSYWLGLKGPNLAIDTACSSSLVAVHLACQALRNGECRLALAGGSNVTLSPETAVSLSRLRALSPTGRCHSFSADADGFVRSEGAGMIVLERLSDALLHGHRVLGVIRGSAINQDGRSNGLTAPNGPSQSAVIREALRRCDIAPADIGYAECHGTGTPLGDPIEVQALDAVLSEGRPPEQPLIIGSLKSNVGHMEGAAGIGGLIKALLALSHERIPKNIHFSSPNPHIPWGELKVKVANEAMDWPRGAKPRYAGVSSFGISGTNAHVVLEEAPRVGQADSAPVRSAELVVLSSKAARGLSTEAERLSQHLDAHPELTLGDVAYNLLSTRSSHEHRLTLAVSSRNELIEGLRASARQVSASIGAISTDPKVAFVFPGQGSQWLGMGRELFAEEPAFRAALTQADQAIRVEAGFSVLDELNATANDSRLAQVDVVQPVLFAFQVALAALWRAWGIEPHAVVGHSLGEVAAACVAGALSLEDGAAVICRRSRLLRRISGQGEMALVELSMGDTQAALDGLQDRLAVAVSNGPRSTVVSGEPSALTALLTQLEGRGVFCRRVKVDVASHSPQVDPLLGELSAALAGLSPRSAQITMHSTLLGKAIDGRELQASYWAGNLRQPVLFGASVSALLEAGFTHFVEISAHPLLTSAVEQLRNDTGAAGVVIGSLRREQPERLTLLQGLGALHTHGHPLDASRLFPGGGRLVALPTHAWQRERYWVEAPTHAQKASGKATHHPLLGVRITSAGADAVYETRFAPGSAMRDLELRLVGQSAIPSGCVLELLRAGAEHYAEGLARELATFRYKAPLLLGDDAEGVRVQVVLTEHGQHAALYSQPRRSDADGPWTLHATAEVKPAEPAPRGIVQLDALRARCKQALDISKQYADLHAQGIDYGIALRAVKQLEVGSGEVFGQIARSPHSAPGEGYGFYPDLLEAAWQALAAVARPATAGPWQLLEIGRLALWQSGATTAFVHACAVRAASGLETWDLTLLDEAGKTIALASGVHLGGREDKALAPAWKALWNAQLRTNGAGRARPPLDNPVIGDPEQALLDAVRAEVARVLGAPAAAPLPRERPLKDLGFDSLMAVELRSRLSRKYDVVLPATFSFNATLEGVTKTLFQLIGGKPAAETATNGAHASVVTRPEPHPGAAVCEKLHGPRSPRLRLFCFHDAGGSASLFVPFTRLESEHVEVHAVSCPRPRGAFDAALAEQYLSSASDYIAGLADKPYALFGHSLGALLAWRVLQRLIRDGQPAPGLFVPSASPAAALEASGQLDLQRVLATLLGGSNVDASALASFEVDFASDNDLWKHLPSTGERAMLDVPIAAFVGRDDSLASEVDMRQWHSRTTRDFSLTILPGDHQYPYREEGRELLLDELARALSRSLGSRARMLIGQAPRRSTTSIW